MLNVYTQRVQSVDYPEEYVIVLKHFKRFSFCLVVIFHWLLFSAIEVFFIFYELRPSMGTGISPEGRSPVRSVSCLKFFCCLSYVKREE